MCDATLSGLLFVNTLLVLALFMALVLYQGTEIWAGPLISFFSMLVMMNISATFVVAYIQVSYQGKSSLFIYRIVFVSILPPISYYILFKSIVVRCFQLSDHSEKDDLVTYILEIQPSFDNL